MPRRAFVMVFVLGCALPAAALAVSADLDNLQLVPANDPFNVFSIAINTDQIGNDSDTSIVTGAITAQLELDIFGSAVTPAGLELTGGQAMFSDVNFSFLFGAVSVTSSGLAGIPDTPSPPSMVTNGSFPAEDHTFLLNQGTIEAAGQVIDLATMPLLGSGTGFGQLSVVSSGAPMGNDYPFTATITLPTSFDEPFALTDVPIVGTLNGSIVGSGTIQASQDFTLTLLPGDYNGDGALDCDDLSALDQAINMGSGDLAFDANGDGTVDQADEMAWINDIRQAIPGDGDLNDVVDGSDFVEWNANKFQSGTDWCSGDWNHDNQTDGQDFVLWNANKFNQGDSFAVPEPVWSWYGMTFIWLVARWRR